MIVGTLSETAARLGTTPRYVRRLIEEKRLTLLPSDDGTMSVDLEALAAFERARQTRGRPQKPATRVALERELLGAANDDISPRTLARIRHDLSNFTPGELAETLRHSSNAELSELATRALAAPTYLEQKRAQKALRDLHERWEASRFPRGRRPRPLALTDNATTSSTAAAARQALREDNYDLAFRLIIDHIASLAQQKTEGVSELMTRPKSIGEARLDALLHAGIAWIASTADVVSPSWHRALRVAELWNPTGRTVILDKALPQFLQANIYLEARDIGAA